MGMNQQIREIIDLDRRAAAMIEEAEEIAKKIDLEATQIIKSQRDETLLNAQNVAKQNYEVQIQEAERDRESKINGMSEKLERIKAAYHTHKDEWAREIFEELLRQEG